MDFGAIADSLAKQFVTVWNAPVPFLAAVLLAGWVIWKLVQREYANRLADAGSRLELANDRVKEYERKLSGASPDEAGAKVAALEQRIAALVNPPRDPDGVYQHGIKRGIAQGATLSLATSSATFPSIVADGDFDANAEFEFREWRLRINQVQVSNRTGMSGHSRASFTGVGAAILGRRAEV